MSSPEYSPRDQINNSSGMFIGRDLNIEALDAKTKAVLAKISKDAPALGGLLARALRDGVISPDVAFALGAAARSINEDVAGLLYKASRSINEDVAGLLYKASLGINQDVAGRMVGASEGLSETVDELSAVLRSARGVTNSLKSTNSELREWERVAEEMDSAAQNMVYAAQVRDARTVGWSWTSFWWGAGVCAAFVIIALVLWTYGVQR